MSRRQFKAQASSGRLGGFGGFGGAGFGTTQSSLLSYIQEPPDYTRISDSNVVVAFKNLSKKDSTTKARALEDLSTTLTLDGTEIEDAVTEAWVKLYPRLSIDNARRVRQLTHIFNGQLSAKCGKRIAKHLPKTAGPWLAGTFDVDRGTSKAAQDALTAVFPSPEKILGLRKTFQESILECCRDALLNETVQTLSDERTANPEDAKAVYARVISSYLAVIASLLATLPAEEISKHHHTYEHVFEADKFWEFPSHSDASIRKATHKLVQTCLKRQSELIERNLEAISKAYIYKGLPSDQTGSSADYALALESLTSSFPTIWTAAYSGKKSATSRLQQCLSRGSHSGTTAFWDALGNVLRKIPSEILPNSYGNAADLLSAARDGVARKEERFNASAAWPAYFTLVDVVTQSLPEDDAGALLKAFAMPLVGHFICPSEETAKWSISGARAAALVSKVALVKLIVPQLEQQWPDMCQKLVEAAKVSQPEQSKEFDKSQRHVASIGERLSNLQREFSATGYDIPESVLGSFQRSSCSILKECVALLKTRKGKPYGAAAAIEEQLRACGDQLLQSQEYRKHLIDFAFNDIAQLMYTPSQRYLARCLFALEGHSGFHSALTEALRSILEAQESDEAKIEVLRSMFPDHTPKGAVEIARASEQLQNFLASSAPQNATAWAELLKLGLISQQTTDTMLSTLTKSLSLSGAELHAGLSALEQLALSNQPAIRAFTSMESGKELLPSVLRLEQSLDDAVAEKAASLSARLSSAMGDAAADAKYGVILQNLESVSKKSLTIETVLDLAENVEVSLEATNWDGLVPRLDVWRESIIAAMKPLKASLSLLSPLGGTVHLIDTDAASALGSTKYDAEGLSQALRIAMYLTKMLEKPNAMEKLGDRLNTILALLSICVLLAEDNISISGANGLWLPTDSQSLETEVVDFVSDANKALKQNLEEIPSASAENEALSFPSNLEGFQKQHGSASPMAYYAASASARAYENVFELHGYSAAQAKKADETLRAWRATKDTVALVSFVIGYGQPLRGSQNLTRLCNELIADLTDLAMDSNQQNGLRSLVTLNAILHSQDEVLSSVQKTRLIFMVKRILTWLENDTSMSLKAEACKALTYLVPYISDMYGEHWSQITNLLISFWGSSAATSDGAIVSESGLLLLHASLRLCGALHKLSKIEDPNDDLLQTLEDSKDQIYYCLIEVLKSASEVSDETHQPMLITHELLARELSRAPFKSLVNAEDLFPLLYTPSHAIQGAAFDILYRQIPAAQEQVSLDAALDDKTAQLPDELLSLIIDAPTSDSLANASFERTMPLFLRGFLNSWRLLFAHFDGSSYRVKSDYVGQLKEGGYLNGLLTLFLDVLGHTKGRPIDVSKFDVQEYTTGTEPNPERDVQWLLAHLYFLALSHLPSLVKSYFLDIRSRQTSHSIESWTAKFISPPIINANLQAVAEWAEKSVKEDQDFENMTVKVGMRSKEINVGYLVDEQTMAIKVVLPEMYPLESAKVVSVSRVAVKEEKWQSWLRNCQGVITFSNGSITDGLSSWRKNVIGALKGQTECAICYSIISGDKQLPTKRCPTCKNLFHSSCLLKWFKTSNASTCPLCRNPFNFN